VALDAVLPARERILAAALPLFLEHGLANVRTETIREAAGVSNGSLFHAFPTKEAIAVALYVEAIGSYQGALLHELDPSRQAADVIRALVLAHWRWVAAHEAQARFLFEMGRPDWHAEAGARTRDLNTMLEAAYAAWWAQAVSAGAVQDVPLPAARAILLGPSMMALRHWLREGGRKPSAMARLFAEAAVRSLTERSDER
jgi:AcrR family transcriptional regulator